MRSKRPRSDHESSEDQVYHGMPYGATAHHGVAGAVWAPGGRPRVVFGFTIAGGKIVEINLLADPTRLSQLDLVIVTD